MHELSHQLEHGAMPRLSGYERRYLESALQFFPRTQAEALAWSGKNWGYAWDNFTSAGVTTLWGGRDLAAATSPQGPVATPFAGRTAGHCPDGSLGMWKALSTSYFSPDLGNSMAVFSIVRIPSLPSTGQADMCGKSGGQWYRTYVHSVTGTVSILLRDSASASFEAQVAVNHIGPWIGILTIVDWTTNLATIRTPFGSAQVSLVGIGSLATTGPYRIGQTVGTTPEFDVAIHMIAEGTDAEGWDDAAIFNRMWRGP